ncbi:hypothetical protein GCM10009805_27720 [Leucobacter chromiireducens subsp. solipictus]|uniref:TetR family transcriptional regulator n=2 Tax=Leucobacter TaxID=55968 RepID=A0ABS1SIE9_9MICO|nr:TetR family transcriptional regulator [Leucobacter chromiireducens subsp. solipictus]
MPERRSRRRPGENREYLIEAGLEEFGLSGYHGTSTARIAARAQVPQPHVYTNFRTKRELFLACVDAAVGRLLAGDGQTADERLVLQAIAAVPEPSLSEPLRAQLAPLFTAVDAARMGELLSRAATELLS